MKPVIANEVYAFLGMTVLGVSIGIIFDIFRAFRRSIIKKEIYAHITDIIFWSVSLALAMKSIYYFNDGVLRVCFIFASFLGALLYFFTLSRPFMRVFSIIFEIILKIFKFIFKILLTPTHFLYKILLVTFEGIRRILKKCFKRKKVKKRGCRNDKKECKEDNSNSRSFFGSCFFTDKRSHVTAGNKSE